MKSIKPKLSNPKRNRALWNPFRSRSSLGLFACTFLTANFAQFAFPVFKAHAAPTSDIVVLNSFTTTTLEPGGITDYTLVFQNSTGSAATDVTLTHTLPTSPGILVFNTDTPSENTCGLTLSITEGTPNVTPGVLNITDGTIPAGSPGECRVTIPVQGFTAGPHIPRVLSGELSTSEGENQDATSATVTILESNPATLAKAFSPNTIPGGGSSTVTITITNPNPYDLTGTSSTPTLTDTLPNSPNQLEVNTSGATPSTTCADGSVNILSGNTGIELIGGTIPADGSCTVSFPVTQSNGGIYTNTLAANSLSTVNLISNDTAVSSDLSVQTEVIIEKNMAADTLTEGQTTQLTIDISNGGLRLRGVELTDSLPPQLVVANPPNASTDCTSSGATETLGVSAGDTNIVLNSTNISSNAIVPRSNTSTNTLGSCSINVDVTADPDVVGNISDAGEDVINTIPANSLVSNSGRTNDDPTSDTIRVLPAIEVSKSYSNENSVAPGNTTQLRINVTNNSPINATNVSFTDTFPSSNLKIAATPNLSNSDCGSPVITATPGSSSIQLTGGTILSGETCTVRVDVEADAATPVGTTFDNVIPHDQIGNAEGLDSDGATTGEGVLTVISAIEITKTFIEDTIRRGLTSTVRLEIKNNRREIGGVPQPLTGVTITDALPTNLELDDGVVTLTNCDYGSAAPTVTGASAGSTSISLSGAAISPVSDGNAEEDTCIIEFDVIETDQTQANYPTPYDYTNETSGFDNDQNQSQGLTATDDLTVVSPIQGEKEFQSPKITANGRSAAVITLNNSFPSGLTNLSVTDSWTQNNVVVANPPNASTTCPGGSVSATAGARTISLNNGTLPAQVNDVLGICEIRFDVIMDATGDDTFENIVEPGDISNAQDFTIEENISGTLERTTADVSVGKEFSPQALYTGDPSTLTLTINNPNNGIDITELGLIDNMPSNMIVHSDPNTSTNCPNGSVSAIAGNNSFELSDVILGIGESCQVEVQVTTTGTGNLTNAITTSNITSKENVTNPFPAEATITSRAALRPTKTFDREEIAGGVPSTMTLTILNRQTDTSLADLSNVSLTDNFPTDLVIATPANASTTCSGGTLTANSGDSTLSLTGATLEPQESCEIEVDVTSTVSGTYTNTIEAGNVTATIQQGGTSISNTDEPADTLVVTENINDVSLILVKRITSIDNASNPNPNSSNPNDGTALDGYIDEGSSTDDNPENWPLSYIQGAVDGGTIAEDDDIEYTIYFRNLGNTDAESVRICDRIQPYQTVLLGSFSGGADFEIEIGDGSAQGLTASNDTADRAVFIPAGNSIPSDCNITGNNTNGVIVIDVTGATGIPNLTALPKLGTSPDNSYGLIRLRTKVTPE